MNVLEAVRLSRDSDRCAAALYPSLPRNDAIDSANARDGYVILKTQSESLWTAGNRLSRGSEFLWRYLRRVQSDENNDGLRPFP